MDWIKTEMNSRPSKDDSILKNRIEIINYHLKIIILFAWQKYSTVFRHKSVSWRCFLNNWQFNKNTQLLESGKKDKSLVLVYSHNFHKCLCAHMESAQQTSTLLQSRWHILWCDLCCAVLHYPLVFYLQ